MIRRALVGLAVSALFLYLLLSSVSFTSLASALVSANPLVLLPALVLYFCGVWVRSLRWRYLLLPVKPVGVGVLFRTLIVGFTINNLLPARLGEIARALMLSRSSGVPASATLGSILVERFFDGLALTAFLVVGLALVPDLAGAAAWLATLAQVAAAVFLAALLFAWVLAARPGLMLRLAGPPLRLAPPALRERLSGLLVTFVSGFASLRQPGLALRAVGLSLVAWTFEAGMYYLILLGFHLPLGFPAALLGTAAANLGTMIPSSPGYIGTFHLPLQAVIGGVYGVAASTATGYTLVVHAALYIPVVLLGLLFLARDVNRLRLSDFGFRTANLRPVPNSSEVRN